MSKVKATIVRLLISILFALATGSGRKVAFCLRINSIEVPAAAMNGSQITLACNFELEASEQLYSVKWYKNYVEFYRFQPTNNLGDSQVVVQHSSASISQQQQHSKHEFELEGINLQLTKSNASHVHLRQVNLASEGSYKCEVSADSPSFATVSLERQMKVYVLPKQKLSIVDNSPDLQQQQSKGLNDLVDLTCISGPSRPPAKLSWLLNDEPIPGSPSSPRLGSPTGSRQQQSMSMKLMLNNTTNNFNNNQLMESRLSLSFRIQPHHMQRNGSSQATNSRQQLRLRCLAKLSVEFSTETSILVSGGKANLQRKKQQQPQPLPAPSSLQTATAAEVARPQAELQVSYRWPAARPLAGGQQQFAGVRRNANGAANSEASEDAGLVHQSPWLSVIWTGSQIKDQAEHIEQMLQQTQPNQLEQPSIEAKTLADTPEVADEEAPRGESGGEEEEEEPAPPPPSQLEAADYQLNEQVRFTCSPRLQRTPNTTSLLDRALGVWPQVQVNWIMNNKEIRVNQVNAFDGNQFYDSRAQSDTTSSLSKNNSSSRNSPAKGAAQSSSIGSNRELLIEFSPPLFQLKELNLKCRTTIEQPLIEYESQLVVALASSSQFIEASSSSSQNDHSRQHRLRASILRNQSGNSSNNQNRRGWVTGNWPAGAQRQNDHNKANSASRSLVSKVVLYTTNQSFMIIVNWSLFASLLSSILVVVLVAR